MSEPKNLKSALSYAIGLIGEEASEIAQAEHKIDRFGLLSTGRTGLSNFDQLQKEIWDLVASVDIANLELEKRGLPKLTLQDDKAHKKKIAMVAYHARTSMNNGTLAEPLQIMPTISPD